MIDFYSLISGDKGGNVVLITQDGVQLPPLTFPSGSSLLSFLTCLEQGLNPNGRLDPPLLHKNSSTVTWPRLKKNLLPERLVNAFHNHHQHHQHQHQESSATKQQQQNDDTKNKAQSQDFVFRLIFTMSSKNLSKFINKGFDKGFFCFMHLIIYKFAILTEEILK